MKIDPSGALLHSFIDLNNLALSRFSAEERARIGIHTCPGGDRDSTHSADVDYGELLPSLFELQAGNFYVALAGETDRVRVLRIIRQYLKPDQRVFVGVIATIDPRIETPEEVRDLILEAARYIPVEQLGTTDDCGFSPFSDDTSTTRDTAFAKIRARVAGTRLAWEVDRRQVVPADEEEELLRSVAIQNAKSILLARQRAEQELLRAKQALERKTHGAARDAAGDVGRDSGHGRARRRDGLQPPGSSRCGACRPDVMDAMEHRRILEHTGPQFDDPQTVPVPDRGDLQPSRPARASTFWSCRTEECSSGTPRPSSSRGATSAASGASATSPRAGAPKRRCATRAASSSC